MSNVPPPGPGPRRPQFCSVCGGRLDPADLLCPQCDHPVAPPVRVQRTVVAPAGSAAASRHFAARDPVFPEDETFESRAENDDAVAVPLLTLGVVMLLAGVALIKPGWSIALGLAMIPALARTVLLRWRRRRTGGGLSAGETVGQFMISTAITVGLVGLLGATAMLALFIGFCCICFAGMDDNVVGPVLTVAFGLVVVAELTLFGYLAYLRWRHDTRKGRD